ncbi:MAG: YbhB/YbcL family Raf kinase inhibitor-like protein [Spirochaetales bacterium]|nr:MAG: YbhB/YbcL family Raf kinase inhibitor-like protein [Spirochaetales bacterium]
MRLTSPSFADGANLPYDCAYEGGNSSPALAWTVAPSGSVSLALTCVDTDAPFQKFWVHWLAWNIPAWETRRLVGQLPYARLEDGTEQGLNDFLEFGWGGPCPPSGTHRYVFTLYALDSMLKPDGPGIQDLFQAMEGHVIEAAELAACYAPDGAIVSYEAIAREGRAKFRYSRTA